MGLPALKDRITEEELTRFLIERHRFETLHKEHEKLEKHMRAWNANLIERFEAGAKVESKVFTVAVDRSFTRRVVEWKDKYVELAVKFLGVGAKEAAQSVLDSTEPTEYPRIAISKKA